jgi:hypothetical protein
MTLAFYGLTLPGDRNRAGFEIISQCIGTLCFLQLISIYPIRADSKPRSEGGDASNEAQRAERIELFKDLCHQRGGRCTVQRRVIFETALALEAYATWERRGVALEPAKH